MSFLNQMYGRKRSPATSTSEKNPNRVAGGLKGQGADHFTMLGEDGLERQIPTQKYVQSLEEQLRVQRAAVNVLERKFNRLQSSYDTLVSAVNSLKK